MEVQLFKALGDPVRLNMVERLSKGKTYTLKDLTKNLGISRQGARKQVHALEAVGLVRAQPVGREVHISLERRSLARARKLIARLEREWDTRLDKLKNVAEKDQPNQ